MFKPYYQKHLIIFKIICLTKIGCEILSITNNNTEDSLYYLKFSFTSSYVQLEVLV